MISTTLRQQQLLTWLNQETPYACDELDVVSGDASFRRYFRFLNDGQSYIAVDTPPATEKNTEFVAVSIALAQAGVRVPQVLAADIVNGFMCLTDLGNTQLSSLLHLESVSDYYQKALSVLDKLQHCHDGSCMSLLHYDRALVERDFGLFREWFVQHLLELSLSEAEQKMLDEMQDFFVALFAEQPQVAVHRDFHSRNLMLVEQDIAVIDFQDLVIGPATYDAVSLLRDAYCTWPDEKMKAVLFDWQKQTFPEVESQRFYRWYELTGLQRHLKILGIFSRLYLRDGKQGYVKDMPRVMEYIKAVTSQYSELTELNHFLFQRLLPVWKEKQCQLP